MKSLRSITVFFTFLLVLVTLFSCADDGMSNVIKKARTTAQDNPTPENYSALIKAYVTEYEKATSKEEKLKYLNAAIKVAEEQNLDKELDRLHLGIITVDPLSDTSGKLLLDMAKEVKAKGNELIADIMFKGISENFESLEKEAMQLMKKPAMDIDTVITRMSYKIFDEADPTNINKDRAFSFIDMCEAYALTRPSDSAKSAEYLFKGAEMARSIKSYNKAMSLYDMLIMKYPETKKAASALFIKGYLMESVFKRYDEAKEVYVQFLEKYPNDELADDVEILLDNLGKSDEELYNRIRNK